MASQTQLSLAELQGELCKLHKIAKDAAHARDVADVCGIDQWHDNCV